jgi:hypothetical protein
VRQRVTAERDPVPTPEEAKPMTPSRSQPSDDTDRAVSGIRARSDPSRLALSPPLCGAGVFSHMSDRPARIVTALPPGKRPAPRRAALWSTSGSRPP